MELEIVYQSDFIRVEVNEEHFYIQATWLQQPTSRDFREQLKRVVEIALEKNLVKALFDVRAKAYLEIGDQNWLIREIVPQFSGRGLWFAYVVSLTAFEIMDIIRIQEAIQNNLQLKGHLKIEIFMLPKEAEAWLLG
jgi:hypothetical protein